MDNSLGERLISDAEELIKSGAPFEDIREAMNAVYRHYKGELRGCSLSDKRLIKVFSLECLMEDKFLPLENEPIYDELDDVRWFTYNDLLKMVNNGELDQDQVDTFNKASKFLKNIKLDEK